MIIINEGHFLNKLCDPCLSIFLFSFFFFKNNKNGNVFCFCDFIELFFLKQSIKHVEVISRNPL